MHNGLRLLVAGAAVTLVASCGGSSGGGAASTTPSGSASASASASATSSGGASVNVASTSLGQVLTGPDGRTLYMFDPDKQGASTCYDQCATAWPPLTTTGAPVAGTGAEASMLGTTARKDGSMQVTYNKWPLYYFVKDTKPGDVTGQKVKNVWWVLDAKGQPVRK